MDYFVIFSFRHISDVSGYFEVLYHSKTVVMFIYSLQYLSSPTADIVKPLLCMECSEKSGVFQLSTCLFKYWYQAEGRELAHVIAQTLTKLVNQTGKRRQGR